MDAEFHTNDQLSDEQKKDLHVSLRYDSAPEPDVEGELRRIMSMPHHREPLTKPHRKSPILPWITAAAAVAAAVALISVALWHKPSEAQREPVLVLYAAADKPMEIEMSVTTSQSADSDTRASANANKVIVKDEVLDMRLEQSNPDDPLEERIITTPDGKNLKLILADATQVTLSAGSKLRFPLRFHGNTRTVYLEGEAYFVVAKDPDHQFDVVTASITTTALGTEFYVRAFPGSDIQVSLVGGVVRVEDRTEHQSVLLEPGQDAIDSDGRLMVVDTDTRALQYWRDGYFYFQDCPLDEMMVDIGKWYNVSVELNDSSLKGMRIHFVAGRDEDIADIIDRLNRFEYFEVTLDDNTITIDK